MSTPATTRCSCRASNARRHARRSSCTDPRQTVRRRGRQSAGQPVQRAAPGLREQAFAHLNPLTYQVDALRALMIDGGPSTYPIALDIAVLAGTVVVLVAIASRLYPRLAQ